MQLKAHSFQRTLLKWFDQHGRKTLPWQENKTPYRVWVSEIMLQQTQVATVIDYFLRFMHTFPDIESLAQANEDDVLHLWTGLGYYSRARNLHRAAKMVVHDFSGKFPDNLNDLIKLPGVGRSTAGAILAIAFKKRAPILDGNVKRVLARYFAIEKAIDKKVENDMWQLAFDLTPTKRSADYTQAIMDLGATLCTRSKPDCDRCPFAKTCGALGMGLQHDLPRKVAKKAIPTKNASFLVIRSKNGILLQKRQESGVWRGLWCFPQVLQDLDENTAKQHVFSQFHAKVRHVTKLNEFTHIFSHYRLNVAPWLIDVAVPAKVMDGTEQIWYNLDEPQAVGLPKPVIKILDSL